MKFTPLKLALFLLCLLPYNAAASEVSKALTKEIADFLNLPVQRVFLECFSHEIDFPVLDGQKTMRICLRKSDKQKRCEISIKDLKTTPALQKISFEAMIENSASKPEKWFSLMQIHSFPDKGESWRCSPFSLEYSKSALRLFNRWDPNKISKTDILTCASPETSISSKTIFSGIQLEKWNKISLDLKLSFENDGYIKSTLNNQSFPVLHGPNLYNDKRPPYLKLGIYKPNSWDKHHKISCVTYRNIDISGMSE